jgi:hypothetical protein
MNMLQQAVDLMLKAGSDDWITAFCRLPGLMSEEISAGLAALARDMPPEIQTRVDAFIRLARHVEEKMRIEPAGYPFGEGPLENLHEQRQQGHIGIEVAKQQAREMAANGFLHAAYLRVLSHRCVQLSYQGRPEEALGIQTLILSAAELMPDPLPPADSVKLAAEFIRSASWSLYEKGNAELFHRALDIGEKGLLLAQTDAERAELQHVLGILHLDPYAANRAADWYTVGIRQWVAAGGNPAGCELGSAAGLPLPGEALAAAEARLRSAVRLGSGPLRRDALKALVQTLESGRNAGRQPAERELLDLCDEALALLEEWPEPEQSRYVLAVRAKTARNLQQSGEAARPPIETLDHLMEKMGREAGLDAWVTAMGLLVHQAPDSLLATAAGERSLFMRHANEAMKESLWRYELKAMAALAEHGAPQQTERDAAVDLWRAVGQGLESPARNREQEALERLAAVVTEQPEAARRHGDALLWLAAILELGLGADAFNAGDYENAARHYALTLQRFVDLELVKFSCEILERLHTIIPVSRDRALDAVTAGLIEVADRLDPLLGERALGELDAVANTLIAQYTGSRGSLLGLIWAMEIAKGRVFRALYRQEEKGRYAPPAHVLQLLGDIRALEGDLPEEPSRSGLTDETVLGAFFTETAPTAGSTPDSELRNLRMSFDRGVTRDRLMRQARPRPVLTREDAITGRLPATTVLIDMYAAGRIGVNLAYTSEGAECFVVEDRSPFGGTQLQLTDDTFTATMKSAAAMVELVRNGICAEPGPFAVDQQARPLLDEMLQRLLGHGVERLQAWWDRGKRHLCFVPHGALHFLPLHLLTWNGKPLADQWIVTCLPNTVLLENGGETGEARPAAGGSAALGLGYANHPTLPPIENSIPEVTAVADAMGIAPDLDAMVTKTRVRQALARCGRVHLSCHGRLHPEAPELQHLYLAQDSEDGGKLYAYELSGLDLRHVELVTLSACQSGLGRFDQGDNLRGLEANLFLSGVRTIVDTLWNVSAPAAELFFPLFYRQLRDGAPMLAAFRAAQEETRRQYPAYRDWGAFRLSGKW